MLRPDRSISYRTANRTRIPVRPPNPPGPPPPRLLCQIVGNAYKFRMYQTVNNVVFFSVCVCPDGYDGRRCRAERRCPSHHTRKHSPPNRTCMSSVVVIGADRWWKNPNQEARVISLKRAQTKRGVFSLRLGSLYVMHSIRKCTNNMCMNTNTHTLTHT